MKLAVIRPTSDPAHAPLVNALNPWMYGTHLSHYRAMRRTAGRGLSHPGRLLRDTPTTPPPPGQGVTRSGASYAWTILGIAPLACMAGHTLLVGAMSTREDWLDGLWLLLMAHVVLLVTVVLPLTLVMLSMPPIALALLRLTGPCDATIQDTRRAILYTSGVCLPAAAIPCLGFISLLVILPAWTVCAGLAMAQVHRVGRTRAILAACPVPGACFIMAAIGYVAILRQIL